MAKGLTPIIGLAVVVALALAAVFGAMSLTNPAFAAVGAPADAELAERTFSPQDASTTVAVGEALSYDIAPLITGGGDNYDGLAVGTPISCVPACAGGGPIDGLPTVVPDFSSINLTVPAADVVATGRVRVSVVVNLEDSTTNQTITVDVTVTTTVNEPSTLLAEIPDQTVTIRASDTSTESTTIDLNDYFMSGRGNGVIISYTITINPVGAGLAASVTGSDLELSAKNGASEGLVAVTVEANDKHGDPNPRYTFFVKKVAPGSGVAAPTAGLPSFTQSSNDPADSANYTVKFGMSGTVNTRQDDLIIEFHEDYGIPSTMRTTSVAITTDGGNYPIPDADADSTTTGSTIVNTRTFTPEDVTVDGEKILLSLGDMDEQDDRFDYELDATETVTVHFRQSAGITNPTEVGGYNLVAIDFGDGVGINYEDDGEPASLETMINRKISRNEEDGGLGKVVTATGKGYKNGTSLTVFLDSLSEVMWDDPDTSSSSMVRVPMSMLEEYKEEYAEDDEVGNIDPSYIPLDDDGDPLHYRTVSGTRYILAPNRLLEAGEDVLCVDAVINSDDVGSCEFTVTHPTFVAGLNYINAVDGKNGYAKPTTFLLKASIQATPDGGSPGEIMLVQVVDFKSNIGKVTIGGQVWCSDAGDLDPDGDTRLCAGTVDNSGAGNFKITIPNWVRAGAQELKVFDDLDPASSATDSVTLLGPQINVSPQTVLGNQRVSLVGTGFSPGAVIANDRDADQLVDPEISIGGDPIDGGDINDSDPVRVDNGGNWSASVDLPLSEATTAVGERAIRVRDSQGRTGVVLVDIPGREVSITPERGRVGTIAVVRGTGFPSKNDEGESFNIEIVYDASNDNTTTVSALPDASGRFEVQLRIPTTAAIPSTNSVKVEFEDENDVKVVTTVTHEVPEGIITLSETSGGPGSTVTVSGEGFKSFVPISLVKVGTLDVTPAPKPATDGNGMMSFDITIPGLDVGIQTIEVNVGRTTSSTGFTVTESGVNPGNIKEVAVGLEDLGDNFVNIWHFNNDLKTWSFYDGEEGSDLTHLITGETYLLQIKSTVEVILNNDTRNLTCVGANCWNQIVW